MLHFLHHSVVYFEYMVLDSGNHGDVIRNCDKIFSIPDFMLSAHLNSLLHLKDFCVSTEAI